MTDLVTLQQAMSQALQTDLLFPYLVGAAIGLGIIPSLFGYLDRRAEENRQASRRKPETSQPEPVAPEDCKSPGTRAGYMRHQRAAEKPCRRCIQAMRKRQRQEFRQRKGATDDR